MRIRIFARRSVALLMAVAVLTPSFAWAAPTADQMEEARRRYDRALELSDEGNYDEALLELQRAYALAPAYRLLYNLGVVSVAVHDYVKAVDYYDRYLVEGGADIEPARAAEVRSQLERLRTRISTLRVTVNVPGAQISVDDVAVGRAPMSTPISINSGRHRVTAVSPGYFPSTVVVEVAGNDHRDISVVLSRAVATTEKPSHPIPWLGWGITAALAAGTAVSGVLALNAASSYDSKVSTLGVSSSDVSSAYRTTRVWSLTSDGLLIGTVIAAGVSFYLTIRPVKQTKDRTAAALHITPTGLSF